MFRLTLISVVIALCFNNCARQGFFGLGEGFSVGDAPASAFNIYGIGEGSPREQQAKTILQAKCANCHTPPLNNGGLKDIMNIPMLIIGGWIIPGDPMNSKLFIEIQSNRMPRNNPPLTVAERETIRAWLYGDPGVGNMPVSTPTPLPGATPTPTPAGGPTYANVSATILVPKCTGCHSAANKGGGLAFDTYASTLVAVIPGNPNGSPIFQATMAARMPKGMTPLSNTELTLISNWISAGALNN